jgi:hypothetical protein
MEIWLTWCLVGDGVNEGFQRLMANCDQVIAKIGKHAWGVTPYMLLMCSISTNPLSEPGRTFIYNRRVVAMMDSV